MGRGAPLDFVFTTALTRAETHHSFNAEMMGFAPLYPSYRAAVLR